jgi:hypothetical protein
MVALPPRDKYTIYQMLNPLPQKRQKQPGVLGLAGSSRVCFPPNPAHKFSRVDISSRRGDAIIFIYFFYYLQQRIH